MTLRQAGKVRVLGREAWSLILAFTLHAGLLWGSVAVLGERAEYGMSASSAAAPGSPNRSPKALPPEEQFVLLEDPEGIPEAVRKPTPRPTAAPEAPAPGPPGKGGALQVAGYYLNPPPPYPAEARRLKQEGLVLLRVRVDAKGRVESLSVAQGSGHPLLDEAATGTVKGWRFKPARLGGIAVETTVEVPVLFKLKG